MKQDMTRGVDIDKHIAELHRKKATLGRYATCMFTVTKVTFYVLKL